MNSLRSVRVVINYMYVIAFGRIWHGLYTSAWSAPGGINDSCTALNRAWELKNGFSGSGNKPWFENISGVVINDDISRAATVSENIACEEIIKVHTKDVLLRFKDVEKLEWLWLILQMLYWFLIFGFWFGGSWLEMMTSAFIAILYLVSWVYVSYKMSKRMKDVSMDFMTSLIKSEVSILREVDTSRRLVAKNESGSLRCLIGKIDGSVRKQVAL